MSTTMLLSQWQRTATSPCVDPNYGSDPELLGRDAFRRDWERTPRNLEPQPLLPQPHPLDAGNQNSTSGFADRRCLRIEDLFHVRR